MDPARGLERARSARQVRSLRFFSSAPGRLPQIYVPAIHPGQALQHRPLEL